MTVGRTYGMALLGPALAAALQIAGSAAALAADPVEIDVSGQASVVAGVSDGDAKADLDGEIDLRGTYVFRSGLEVGAGLGARFDKQQPNQIFGGGRYSSYLIGGPRGVGPSTSDAYLQGAYAFVRGGFGEVVVGREQGVARTLAVTAPTLFQAATINDWRADLSGLNDVHTVNDLSGYATKVTFLPPANVFGGVLGGLQLGVSYAPTLPRCGEDLCAPENRLLITPDGVPLNDASRWGDVLETALYYQKRLGRGADGVVVGVGASYVTADEDTRINAPLFEDYEAYSVGLNLGYRGITVGGSLKSTNAGLAVDNDDGYLAFDAGITFRTGEDKGDWGVMLGYGQSEANIVGPSLIAPTIFTDTQTVQAGVTYFLSRGITIGAAAQFIESDKPTAAGGQQEAATAVIESSIRF